MVGAAASVPWFDPDPALKPWFFELGALPAAAAIQTNDDELLCLTLISTMPKTCTGTNPTVPSGAVKGVSIPLRYVQHCDAKSEKR